jgi:hypothetical protein
LVVNGKVDRSRHHHPQSLEGWKMKRKGFSFAKPNQIEVNAGKNRVVLVDDWLVLVITSTNEVYHLSSPLLGNADQVGGIDAFRTSTGRPARTRQ